eukprot:TRINITY_DN459_c0_g1_i40.p1 TRINITY_DN459_c0_g1~~TRINITY_DN459_c0_g1_i40.p1  ORF type:complete len:105 (+),score=20.01 TRINITY_DN459_c0_g1_i40:46-315(+)
MLRSLVGSEMCIRDRYLDVSVLPVRLVKLCIHLTIPSLCWVGFPIRKSVSNSVSYRLLTAYRRLVRPSSPLTAKASTVCASSLDPRTLR